MTRSLDHWRSPAGIATVAGATARIPFKFWGFGESIAVEALLAVGGAQAQAMREQLERWAERSSLAGDPLAHVAPGVPLLTALSRSGSPGVLARVRELAAVLEEARVGRSGARIHRPDLSGWSTEVWVDCMHLDGPFLARYATVGDDPVWSDRAAELLLSHASVLQDDGTGLFSHGFDDLTGHPNRVFWGRGQGWALLGMVDTLAALPRDHPAEAEIVQRARALIDALARHEDGAGRWHTVVDCTRTYLEASISAFVALGVQRAIRSGLVSGAQGGLAERALEAAVGWLRPNGGVSGVSLATPVGPTPDQYSGVACTDGDEDCVPWGQGPVLLALLGIPAGCTSGTSSNSTLNQFRPNGQC